MNLARRLNQVLEMRPGQEIAEVHEFAVVLVLDIDHTPSVLSSSYLSTFDDDVSLRSDDGERNPILDLSVESALLLIEFIVVVGVHLQVVELEFLLDSLLEGGSLLEGESVRLSDDRNDIDDVR